MATISLSGDFIVLPDFTDNGKPSLRQAVKRALFNSAKVLKLCKSRIVCHIFKTITTSKIKACATISQKHTDI